jgi:predicted  nucleic acid-binding Zn-ribbon protein
MVKQQTRQSGLFGDWQQLNASAVANAAEIQHLEGARVKLEGVLTRLQDVLKQQAALVASKQEMSKQMKDLFLEGQRHATVLRKGIAAHFGPRAEKLLEFKLQPYRGRTRKEKPEEPELPEAPKPPAPTAS